MEKHRITSISNLISFVFLSSFFSFSVSLAVEFSPRQLVVEVATTKAFIWNKPGYSWKDCRPGESGSIYSSEQEKAITIKRYKSGGKQVCQSRNNKTDLFEAGETLEIVMQNGSPVYDENHQVLFGGGLVPKGFYKVKSKSGKIGWVSEDQVTRPHEKEEEDQSTPPKSCNSYCEKAKQNQRSSKDIKEFAKDLMRETDKQLQFPGSKNEKEVDHFACLYRDSRIPDSKFAKVFADTKKAALEASKAFKMPYSLILCTMMTESSLYFNPKEKDEYRGIGQVGSAFVEDLQLLMKKKPYSDQWDSYSHNNPTVQITDSAVRKSSDPRATAVAVAMGMSWIYNERLQAKDVKCMDCSIDAKFNRKDLYMMVTGYNWGPYSLKKVSKRTPADMRRSFPPPKESRDYMVRMENCLAKGHFSNFKEENYNIEQSNKTRLTKIDVIKSKQSLREQQLSKLKLTSPKYVAAKKNHEDKKVAEQKRIDFLQQMIDLKASAVYEEKINYCAANYPRE